MHLFDVVAVLIFLSGLFIFLNTFYLKLPSSVGMIILTLLMSFTVLMIALLFPHLNLAQHIKEFDFRDVLNQVVISVILFAGGLKMNMKRLGNLKVTVIVLSIVSALLSTFVIGSLLYFILSFLHIEMSYMFSLVFGAVISSTDPISATNITGKFPLPKSLEMKVEGESLFNGAFSVVLAFVLYHIMQVSEGHEMILLEVARVVSIEILGGVAIGIGMGYIGYLILNYIDNDEMHIEVLITIAMVMVGSFISEYFAIYSKLVALIMGLMIGNLGRVDQKDESSKGVVNAYVYKFWNLMEQTMAVLLFVLMGLEMLVIEWRMDYFAVGFLAVNIVWFGRWLSVYLPVKMLSQNVAFHKNTVSVMTWSAFRGGLPIALILALDHFTGKEMMITMTYVVIVCSILFQGFTLPMMMRERFFNPNEDKKILKKYFS
ncbi:cation:proton antiporter [Reichenbachiella agarivorans]|uniref:Cation:proton antiporter n=1 Tax=Reichenbachiella agarivorans TaxID=2979464 RepID=A0ABY6CMA9_9BACT|nr:cation:proton antiporter [Reichenbachiella agarivorans]UXP31657.1 cation:proton antiporter [Reichenbachiella agarivorans]